MGRVLILAIIPKIAFMVYVAISGLEFHTVSKGWRPPVSSAYTWAKSTAMFVLNGAMVYVAFALVMILVYAIARPTMDFARKKR